MEDVTVSVNYGNYRFANKDTSFNTAQMDNNGNTYTITTSEKKDAANEFDLGVTYDYTEDVQFGLSAGWLLAGNAITNDSRDAQQLIGSMKVTF